MLNFSTFSVPLKMTSRGEIVWLVKYLPYKHEEDINSQSPHIQKAGHGGTYNSSTGEAETGESLGTQGPHSLGYLKSTESVRAFLN